MATIPTPSLPGEQFAAALAAIFKAFDDLNMIMNSPAMIAARKSEDVQKILAKWDADLKAAQKSGDVARIDQESSG